MLPLVVVPGLGDRALSWKGFAESLGPGVTVLAIDLPGHGEAAPSADYTYAGLVSRMSEEVAGIDRFALLGHSVGAAVAWLFAARNPARVSQLILVEPAAPHQSPFLNGPTPEPRHPFTFGDLGEAREALRHFDPTVTEEDIRSTHRRREDGRWEPDFDPAIYPALVEDGRAHAQAYRRELGAIRCPTFVIGGEHSFVQPALLEEIAGGIPNAHLGTVRGAGHAVHRQSARELARAVVAFLDGRSLEMPDWY